MAVVGREKVIPVINILFISMARYCKMTEDIFYTYRYKPSTRRLVQQPAAERDFESFEGLLLGKLCLSNRQRCTRNHSRISDR